MCVYVCVVRVRERGGRGREKVKNIVAIIGLLRGVSFTRPFEVVRKALVKTRIMASGTCGEKVERRVSPSVRRS